MAITRRFFLTSSLTGAGVLVLASCSSPSPTPTASRTSTPSRTPSPTPTPTSTIDPAVQPTAFRRSQWGKDAYSYGSASYLTTKATASSRADLAAPIDDKVFFAGEATAADAPGTLRGAYESGLTAAAQVADVAKRGERVAVIGAGLAGVTAARTLANGGFDVVVVEARGRIGGRISPVDSSDWPIEIQMGAGVVGTAATTAGPSLETLLSASGVTLTPLDDAQTARNGDTATAPPATATVEAALTAAAAWAAKQTAPPTANAALTQSGAGGRLSSVADASGVSDTERLAYVLDEVLPARFGADPSTLSADGVLAGAAALLPTGAALVTKSFSAYLTEQLGKLDVLKASNVTRITSANQGVGLRLVTGESLSADRVVVTVPLGVLKKKRIEFDPALPAAKLAAVEALGMGVQDALWFRFDSRLWSTEATVWAILDDTAPCRVWLNFFPATGYPLLVGLVGGAAATALEKLGDSEVRDAALTSLLPYFDMVPSPSASASPDAAAPPGASASPGASVSPGSAGSPAPTGSTTPTP